MFGASGLVGNYIFGYVQDTLGRKPAFYIYLLIQCIFGIATAFADHFWIWFWFRIAVGFTVPAILASPYVIGETIVFQQTKIYRIIHFFSVYFQLSNLWDHVIEQQ